MTLRLSESMAETTSRETSRVHRPREVTESRIITQKAAYGKPKGDWTRAKLPAERQVDVGTKENRKS
jgi:hypothetical protein